MESLEALLQSYSEKKAEVSKLRKQVENKLKVAISKKRRSSSSLISLENKEEDLVRIRDHLIKVLNQHHSQKESLERLKIAAEERLKHEQDARDKIRQQSEYGAPEEKTNSIQRLKYVDEKISELHAELKERESSLAKLKKEIESSDKEMMPLEEQLQKQTRTKPALVEQLNSSTKEEAVLRPKLDSILKIEARLSKALSTVQTKLAEIASQKRKKMMIAISKVNTRKKKINMKRKSTAKKIVKYKKTSSGKRTSKRKIKSR
jgi:chromosome segregation ATPase